MTKRTFVRAHPWVPWVLAFVCLAFSLAFAALGAGVLHGAMEPTDQAVRAWIMRHRPPWSVTLASVVSTIGATQWLALGGAAIVWAIVRRGWAWPILLGLCALTASKAVDYLKEHFDRVRPPTGMLTRASLSFPSGHAAGSVAVALFLAYVVSRTHHAHELRAVVVAFAVATLVGLARVFVDVHWLSDVVGGWVVGTAIAVGYCAIWEWTQRYQREESDTVRPSGVGEIRS